MARRMLLAALPLILPLASAKSIIATFSDTNCQESITSLDGPNGYPNGSCTDFRRSGTYGSFQVVGLDAGCAVTIYVDDLSGDICSGPLQVASIAQCYNATWAFYSIDMCDPAGAGNTNIPTLPSTAISSTSSTTSLSSIDSAAAASASSASASATAASSSGGSNTGAIVGGVVGGVLGLAAIIGLTIFLTVRTMRRNRGMGDTGGGGEVSEMHADSMLPKQKPIVYEKMGNVPDLPPVELPVDARGTDAQAGAGRDAK